MNTEIDFEIERILGARIPKIKMCFLVLQKWRFVRDFSIITPSQSSHNLWFAIGICFVVVRIGTITQTHSHILKRRWMLCYCPSVAVCVRLPLLDLKTVWNRDYIEIFLVVIIAQQMSFCLSSFLLEMKRKKFFDSKSNKN